MQVCTGQSDMARSVHSVCSGAKGGVPEQGQTWQRFSRRDCGGDDVEVGVLWSHGRSRAKTGIDTPMGSKRLGVGGVGQDPPCKQKRLAFKFASAAWVDATCNVGGSAESKWKEMHLSEQRAMPGADTRAGVAAAARSRVLTASHVPLHLRGLLF